MKKQAFSETDLVLNLDGSVYHLHLKNAHIADTVLLVGDQNRVSQISRHFDKVEFKIQNREFATHTGYYKGRRVTALSTGIGTDNVDIVLNELFAATHISTETRLLNEQKRKLRLIRIGTSGALQREISLGSFIASEYGLGLDGLLYYYNTVFTNTEIELAEAFLRQINWPQKLAKPYFCAGSKNLLSKIAFDMKTGITASGTGFYGPQGRNLTLKKIRDVQSELSKLNFNNRKVTNFDMETSALYGLGKVFGFECLTVNVIIANRETEEYLEEHYKAVDGLIKTVLERL
jgi:uridine phosphorylase